jgi:hypothetical protein
MGGLLMALFERKNGKNDLDLLGDVTFDKLEQERTIECASFGLNAAFDKRGKPHIKAFCNGTSSYFSYSKYGLKEAKKWLLERM